METLIQRMLRRFPKVRKCEEVCDICQNVLIRLHRLLNAQTFATGEDFLHATACVIRRELIDLSRRKQVATFRFLDREPLPPNVKPAQDRPDATHDPCTLALWEEVHERIATLPEADRRLFDLLFYQGLTQSQAAAELRIPLRTLKRNWHNTKAKILLIFGNEMPFD